MTGRDIPQEEIDARLQEDLDLAEEQREAAIEQAAQSDPDLVFVKAHTRRKPKQREKPAVPQIAQEASVAPQAASTSPPGPAPGGAAPPGAGGVGAAGPGLGLLGKAGAVGGIVAGAKVAFDLLKPDQTIGKPSEFGSRSSFSPDSGVQDKLLRLAEQAAEVGFPPQSDIPSPSLL